VFCCAVTIIEPAAHKIRSASASLRRDMATLHQKLRRALSSSGVSVFGRCKSYCGGMDCQTVLHYPRVSVLCSAMKLPHTSSISNASHISYRYLSYTHYI
jgi:hypothetical protein